LDNKNIIVTGATGFIGLNLVRRLKSMDFNVHIIVRNSSNISQIGENINIHVCGDDVIDLIRIFEKVKPFLVCHLASMFIVNHDSEEIKELVNSNILFPTHILEAMTLTGVSRMVFIGSLWQHYRNMIYNPVNLYSSTKQAFEDIAKYYCEAKNVKLISLHIPDTYGVDDNRRKLFYILREAIIKKEKLNMSPGFQELDLIYIDDVIDGIILTIEILEKDNNYKFKFYTLTANKYFTLREIVTLYLEVANQKLEISFGGLPYREREIMKINFPIKHKLPYWIPKVNLKEGLIKIINETIF
jgi:nucleoside-diphosphate-sugar epimerase